MRRMRRSATTAASADDTGGHPSADSAASDAAETRRRERAETLDRISTKAQAALWVVVAVVAAVYSDVFRTAVDPSKTYAPMVYIGAATSIMVFMIFMYLVVYLPRIARIRLDWSVYAPRAIPTATACGVISSFSFLIGLWPTYGLLTPLLIFALFMGIIMSTHFMPAC